MSSITVTSQVLGTLTVSVQGTDSTLALSVMATAPANLSIELGTPGATGNTGATGATGAGVAVGGTTGQVLTKLSATNYDTTWSTPAVAALAADQLTDSVVAVNPTAGPTAAGDVLQYDGTVLIWTPGAGAYLPLAGGAMDADAVVTLSDTSNHDSELAGWGLGVQLTNDHAQGTTVEFNGLDTYDSSGHLHINPTGITFPDTTVQTTAGYPNTNPSGFQTSGDVSTYVTGLGYLTDAPIDGFSYNRKNGAWDVAGSGGSVAWGAITGTLTNQTDLTTYLSGNYYPLSGNPSGFLTSVPAKSVYVTSGSAGYYLTSSDTNNIVHVSSSGTIYLPEDASYDFPIGTIITVTNDNLGYISITPGGMGAPTINNTTSPAVLLSYVVELVKVGPNTWFVA